MKIFSLEAVDKTLPKYLQFAQVVREAIRTHKLLPSEKLPSVASIASDLRMNRHTIMRSFDELIAEGWIESKQRVGYTVVKELPIESSLSFGTSMKENDKANRNNEASQRNTLINKYQIKQDLVKQPLAIEPSVKLHQYRLVKQASPSVSASYSGYDYNLAGGQPDLSLFPFNEFKRCIGTVLSKPNFLDYGYGEPAGSKELIEQVTTYLRKSRGITDRDLIITNGSQEAIYITAQLLLTIGDSVAVEALGYPPAIAAFNNAGANIIAIEQDDEGIIPSSLEEQIVRHNIRLIYLTPLHQYPTTVTLSISRRLHIYQIASRYQIPIIEDDYDHEFHYRCQPLAPLASNDPSQLVIYISTLSKIMFPGARIGIMAVNATFANAVVNYRVFMNHKSNSIMQKAVAQWMKSGGFERHLRRATRIYEQRRDHAVTCIHSYDTFEFSIPDGGMALWLKLRKSTMSARALSENAQKENMLIHHEGLFHVDPQRNSDQYIRIGFAGNHEKKLNDAMALIARLLHQ